MEWARLLQLGIVNESTLAEVSGRSVGLEFFFNWVWMDVDMSEFCDDIFSPFFSHD